MNGMNQHPWIRNTAVVATVAGGLGLAGCGNSSSDSPEFTTDYPSQEISAVDHAKLSGLAKGEVLAGLRLLSGHDFLAGGSYYNHTTSEAGRDLEGTIIVDTERHDGTTTVTYRKSEEFYTPAGEKHDDGTVVSERTYLFETSSTIVLQNPKGKKYSGMNFYCLAKGDKLLKQFLNDDETVVSELTTSGAGAGGDTITATIKRNTITYDLTGAVGVLESGDVAPLAQGSAAEFTKLAEKQINQTVAMQYSEDMLFLK